MSENQRIIEKIIFSFKEEMSRIEHNVIKLRDLRARYGVSGP